MSAVSQPFHRKADSAVVYTLIKEIFAQFSTIVNTHQGTVKDYAGDAVFAFWEHPGGFSANQALSACQAALSQLRSVPEIHRHLTGRGLAMPLPVLGWGLTTGRVTMSHYGSRSAGLALVGDCINLAFRLSSMANKTVRRTHCHLPADRLPGHPTPVAFGPGRPEDPRTNRNGAPVQHPTGVKQPFQGSEIPWHISA
jgi:class 3 adenylate cyclase